MSRQPQPSGHEERLRLVRERIDREEAAAEAERVRRLMGQLGRDPNEEPAVKPPLIRGGRPPSGRALTEKQAEILAFIDRLVCERQYPPTIREIGEAFGIRSPNGVKCHLNAIEKKGFLVADFATARGIRIVRRNDGGRILFRGRWNRYIPAEHLGKKEPATA